MAVFNSPELAMRPAQYWDQYMPDMTDPTQLAAYQAWLEGTPGGQPAGQAPTTDPVTGWRSAGSQRMADQSMGEYQANLLNSRTQQAGLDPNSANAKMFQLAMTSRAQVRPEEMQGAYMSMNPDGSPVLLPQLIALLESLGIRPQEYTAPGQAPSGGIPKDPNATSPTGPPNYDMSDIWHDKYAAEANLGSMSGTTIPGDFGPGRRPGGDSGYQGQPGATDPNRLSEQYPVSPGLLGFGEYLKRKYQGYNYGPGGMPQQNMQKPAQYGFGG